MTALRIALVSHVRHPVAPPFMGGMEAHSWHLARGLAAQRLHAGASSETSAPAHASGF